MLSKKGLIKLGLCVVMAAVLFIPVGMAKGDAGQEQDVISLSLEESIEMALKNNPAVEIAQIALDKASMELKQADKAARDIVDGRKAASELPAGMDIGLYSYDMYIVERIVPKQKAMLEVINEKSLEFKVNVLKIQVEQAYYGVLKAQRELLNAMDSLSRAKEQLRLAQVGMEVGTNAKLDVLNAEIMVASQEVAVSYAKNNLQEKTMEFNNIIGLPLDAQVKLTSEFEFEPAVFNLDEVMEAAKEKDLTYITLNEAYKVQKALLDLAKGHYTPNVFAYRDAEYGYRTAKLELQNADQDLELKITKAYFKLLSASERYQLMEKSVEQARESYRLTKLRYEVGMSTQLELEKAGGELDKAKTELLGALYDYNLLVSMFKNSIFETGGGSFGG